MSGYRCDSCLKTFSADWCGISLYQHYLTRHANVSNAYRLMCEQCGFMAVLPSRLWRHILRKHISFGNDDLYQCEDCGRRSKTKDTLQRHMRLSHNLADGTFACDQCKATAKNREQIWEHVVKDHLGTARLQCPVCLVVFDRDIKLKHHIRWKHGERKAKPVVCDHCGQRARTAVNLARHILHVHMGKPEGDQYACDCCQRLFVWKIDLIEHQRFGHSNGNGKIRHFCDDCEHEAVSCHKLVRHVLKFHRTEARVVKCNVCMTIVNETGLKHHKRLHKMKKRVTVCDECGITTVSKRVSRSHIQNVHLLTNVDDMFQCSECEQRFTFKNCLWRHFNLKHRYAGSRCTCHDCGRSFSLRTSLYDHIVREHLNLTSIECNKCGGLFKGENNLQKHKRDRHQSVRWFQCDDCPRRFRDKSSNARHMRFVHQK